MPKLQLLPPKPGTCPICATIHAPEMPHNQQSFFYQYKFHNEHGRFPTWKDAMYHCTAEMKTLWIKELTTYNINIPK